MKTLVVHHSADYDGIFCREIAKRYIPDAEIIGWDFSDPPIDLSLHPLDPGDQVVVMDLPPDVPFGLNWNASVNDVPWLTWIDHHKSAIDRLDPHINGYRIDGVAACRLAWQWFSGDRPPLLPLKEDFINRKVTEPLAVRLAGEYDIWDKRDPNAETFQYSLRSCEPPWNSLLNGDWDTISAMLVAGDRIQQYAKRENASIVKHKSFLVGFEGLIFLCVNTARFNSLLFEAKDVPETGHDALMGFSWTGTQYTVSLYHAKHRTDIDLSVIAQRFGGGGHRGACGFQAAKLPFLP